MDPKKNFLSESEQNFDSGFDSFVGCNEEETASVEKLQKLQLTDEDESAQSAANVETLFAQDEDGNSLKCFGSFVGSNEEETASVEKLQKLQLTDEDESAQSAANVETLFAQDEDGDSYLHIAISKNMEDVALQMISCATSQEQLNLQNMLGQTPLFLSVLSGMRVLVRQLIDQGVDVHLVEYNTMNNVMHVAAANKDSEMLREIFGVSEYLTQQTVDSLLSLRDATNGEGLTPLHIAVKNKDLDFVKSLMRLKVNVEAQDRTAGFTALHHAVMCSDADWVKRFINECNPCLESVTYSGHTAFQLAAENGRSEIQQMLIEAGAVADLEI